MKHPHANFQISLIVMGLVCIALGTSFYFLPSVMAQNDNALREYVGSGECQECHRDVARNYQSSIHDLQEMDIGCESCHGPGSAHIEAADDAGGSIDDEEMQLIQATINNAMDAAVCGQCHSQNLAADSQPDFLSDNLLADYSFPELSNTDYWWDNGHAKQPNMQYNEWLFSAHANSAQDVFSSLTDVDDTCLNCHSADVVYNEDITVENATSGITCAGCHDVHGDTALPSLLRMEADGLCQSCHSNDDLDTIHHPTAEMFVGTQLIDGVDGVASGHATSPDGPTCISCHMAEIPVGDSKQVSHTFTPILPGIAEGEQMDTCTSCHTDLTASYGERFINKQQEDVTERISIIESVLMESENAPQAVVDAIAFIEGDGSQGVHNVAYAERLLNMVEAELGLANPAPHLTQSTLPVSNPQDCIECHAEEHQEWSTSIHATASLQEQFLLTYAENGQPGLCLECHASGYDPQAQTYVYDGVVCSNCHTIEGEHPPAPASVAKDSSVCATCHSGGHASQYEEWASQ